MYFGIKCFLLLTGLVFLSVPRDSVMEMLFEQDNEEKSIASLILDTLVKVCQHQAPLIPLIDEVLNCIPANSFSLCFQMPAQ